MVNVTPRQTAALHHGSTPSILGESTDSPAFSPADPRRNSTVCREGTFTTDR